ncbi:hypothetical protein Pla175_09310 [Pirellulimonas nuda]|uniref:DUF58 domain-containing protein n=1 Tax=Pirellulimonas nuda TaxID=2528009 RepID=A0A518D7X0_9BACT|nr:DUF58 domain-containing protein [Pirellulimonas nuda]QDU87566.1 hypothetical protein Pla175_09310 [Pirellulimonas nuda]
MVEETVNPLDPAVLARIKGLHLRAQRIVEGYVAGLHRSPFQGFSIEFAEHREYAPGDDLRYVDWKAFAKSDKVYLKRYEEETNLIAYLALDVSQSMAYRSEGAAMSKLEYAQTAAAAIAYLVLHQQDSVAVSTFDASVRRHLRPSSSPSQLNQAITVMQETDAQEKTALGPIFHDLAERYTRRGVVIVLSDLFDDPAPLLAGLKHFHHRRHDVIVLHILDPAELDFPFQQATLFKGLEAAGDILAEPTRLRAAYQEEINAFTRQVEVGCHAQAAEYVQVRTDQPLDVVLTALLAKRSRRLK